MNTLKLSVCIPAYNRAEVLPALLDTILNQKMPEGYDFEVLICEDRSPQRSKIAEIVAGYQTRFPSRIVYHENEKNLGYDANIRNLIDRARGEYCFFMGNDDLMCPDALAKVTSAVLRNPDVGVVLRSYEAFDGEPTNVVQTFRYFDKEIFFPAGEETVATIYRRSVVIPGMVIHREEALRWRTERFDGTLLYQLYLVANILVTKNAVFLPDILVLYRNGGIPDFGNSEKEKGKYVPNQQTPESSVHFMRGMLEIAEDAEKSRGVKVYKPILHDIGNYSYPILAIQSGKSVGLFLKYGWQLAGLGLWRSPMFYMYFFGILILGTRRIDQLVIAIKKRLGHTPVLGKVYRGQS